MSLDQFFILSGRGDSLASKAYRKDMPRGCADMYYRQVQFGRPVLRADRVVHEEPAPIFDHEELFTFVHLKRNGLFFVCVIPLDHPRPTTLLSWLQLFAKTAQDFLGSLCEDAIRRNVVLIYELLDESVDPSGTIKTTDAGQLRSKIYSSPSEEGMRLSDRILTQAAGVIHSTFGGISSQSGVDLSAMSDSVGKALSAVVSPKTLPANASHRPILADESKNEVFLDVIENISTVLSPDGSPQTLLITGSVMVKSFLNFGHPIKLKIVLPDSLLIGKKAPMMAQGLGGLYGPVTTGSNEIILDHAIFDQAVDTSHMQSSKTFYFQPGVGEKRLMAYRKSGTDEEGVASIQLPFAFKCTKKRIRKNYVEINISLTPNAVTKSGAGSLLVVIPTPPELLGISCSASFNDVRTSKTYMAVSQNDGSNAWETSTSRIADCDFERDANRIVWTIPKVNANECANLQLQVDLAGGLSEKEVQAYLSRIGPMRLYFDLPSYTATRMKVSSLKVLDGITGREMNPNDPPPARTIGGNTRGNEPLQRALSDAASLVPQGPSHFKWVRYLTKASSYICNLGL